MKTSKVFYAYCVLFIAIWFFVYRAHQAALLPYSFIGFSLAWAIYRLPTMSSKETLQSFFLYERKMPRNEFVGTLVTTNVGFFSSVAFSTYLIATSGIGPAVILVIAWIMGLLWFANYIPQLLPFFRSGSTLHEYIGERYGHTATQKRHLRFYSSVITFLLYVASVGAEVKFTSDVFAGPTHLNTLMLSIVLCSAGVVYVSISGYRGVVSTDRLRFWAILAGVFAIYCYLIASWSRPYPKFEASYFTLGMLTVGPSMSQLLSLFILMCLYQFCVMDMWERCIAVVNTRFPDGEGTPDEIAVDAIRKMIKQSILPFVVLFGAWYGIGLLALGQHWTNDPSQIIQAFVSRLQILSATSFWGAVTETLVVLCFSAAALSTIDGFIIAAVQTVIFDWFPNFREDHKQVKELDQKESGQMLLGARALVLVIGVAAVGIAYASFQIMSFWVGMYSLMLSFFPAIFLSVLDRNQSKHRSARQVSASILIGALLALISACLGTFVFPDVKVLTAMPPFLAAGVAFIILLPAKGQRLKVYVSVLMFTVGLFAILATRSDIQKSLENGTDCAPCADKDAKPYVSTPPSVTTESPQGQARPVRDGGTH